MTTPSSPSTAGRDSAETYWLTRFVFLRMLGLLYSIAFLILLRQFVPLAGEHGLLPARRFLAEVSSASGAGWASCLSVPTLFWIDASDAALRAGAWLGLALGLFVALGGANVPVLAALWLLYMSFVHVGQIFYGYGWELLLLETGFLAVFLCPLVRSGPFPPSTPTPRPVIWLLRWLMFRLMLGAGLIKMRGDSCWRDLTCLVYHYETQPLPNPLSWYLHQLPVWFHRGEVLFNHVVELLVPWMLFAPRRLRHAGGVLLVLFQGLLILSGNLSFLNWLTIAVCLAAFDDRFLARALPASLAGRVTALGDAGMTKPRALTVYALVVLVAFLSLDPVANMVSPGQAMNASFEPFGLVNTYGAFGSVSRERDEIVLQGTDDPSPSPDGHWLDYEFNCKPGDVRRRPCVVSPYHYRIDWQMWFAAMSDYAHEPWLVHLVYKLLRGDPGALSLLAEGPFRDHPPRYVRAVLYRYEFTRLGEGTSAWWRRTPLAEYLPPLSADDPALLDFLDRAGWPR